VRGGGGGAGSWLSTAAAAAAAAVDGGGKEWAVREEDWLIQGRRFVRRGVSKRFFFLMLNLVLRFLCSSIFNNSIFVLQAHRSKRQKKRSKKLCT
jgi:hypothetical protein